ncbi:MAG: metalloregulator ArsR/SmtB family transcription factor [Atribacterota bacterium]
MELKRKAHHNLQDQCEVFAPHTEALRALSQEQIDSETIQKMAEIFKVMADYNRIRILYALSKKELCVCDLSEILHITPSAVSHQLRVLRYQDLVRHHKEGRSVFYRLADNHVINLFQEALNHVLEKKERAEPNETKNLL